VIHTFALTAALVSSVVGLDAGNLTLTIPQNMEVMKHKLNFETDQYIIRRKIDGLELLEVTVGGGAYELGEFREFCLNKQRAWRRNSMSQSEVLVGQPGVNAVYMSYSIHGRESLRIATSIEASLHFRGSLPCRAGTHPLGSPPSVPVNP
jgi:hypothetical protein